MRLAALSTGALVLTAACAITSLLATAAAAQTANGILTYKGPDRDQKLIAGAKQEGAVVFYSGMIVNQALRPVTEAFEKKYPFIKMTFWRADSEVIATKVAAEMRAHNPAGDVIEGTGIGDMAVQEGIAQPAWSPQIDGIPERLRDPRGLWAPTRMSYFSIAYNTKLVAAADAPKTYDDLLNPKWKGKIAWPILSSIGATLFVTNLRLAWGDAKALDYLKRLSQQNLVNFGAGNPRTLVDRVIAGEYPIALQVFAHHPLISAAKGAPVTSVLLPPVASAAATVVMPKEIRHPYAAMLLMDFLLSRDGQRILAKSEYLPVRSDVDPLPQLAPIVPSRAGVQENFISPEKLVAYTEGSSKIVEQLFR
jgi:ABC-type Fe3+ transport system substrate-binding protein